MKKYLSLIIIAALSMSLFSCDSEKNNNVTGDESDRQSVHGTLSGGPLPSEDENSNAETDGTVKEDENVMEYTEHPVKDDASASCVLDKAIILKLGYSTVFMDGKRLELFDRFTAPTVIDGKVYLCYDFVIDQLGIPVSSTDIYTNDYGDSFVSLERIERSYSKTLADSESGVIVIYRELCPVLSGGYGAKMARLALNKLALGNTKSAKMTGDRPVLTVNYNDLMASVNKAKNGMEPWASAWSEIASRAQRLVDKSPLPDTGVGATSYRLAACKDMINARYLALYYIYSEDEAYLSAALEYLLAYAEPMLGTDKYLDYSAPTTDGQADIGLNIAAPLTTACDVYSMLYPYIEEGDRATVENWIRAEVDLVVKGHKYWIKNDYYGKQYGNNHLTAHLMGIVAAAYVLEDDTLLKYALECEDNPADLKEMITHAILMEGDECYNVDPDSDFAIGEIYDRYRVVQSNGFGYSMYHLKFLTYTSLMLRNNGIDPFAYNGENGENLLLPYLAYAEYLIENDLSAGVGHYASDKSLNRESAYSIYSIAYRIYQDSRIGAVIEAMDEDGVKCNENELFGVSTPFLFAYLPISE